MKRWGRVLRALTAAGTFLSVALPFAVHAAVSTAITTPTYIGVLGQIVESTMQVKNSSPLTLTYLSTTLSTGPGGIPPAGTYNEVEVAVDMHLPHGSSVQGNVILYDNTKETVNNGYFLVPLSAVSAWVNLIGGNLSFVQSKLSTDEVQVTDNAGDTLTLVNFAYLASESGGTLGSKQFTPTGTGYTNESLPNAIASAPPTATSISVSDGSTGTQGSVTQGDPVNFTAANTDNLLSGLAAYHYDAIQVTGPNGYSDWVTHSTTGTSGSSDISQMLAVSPGTGSSTDTTSSGALPSLNSSNLSTGTYTATYWVGDGVDRISTSVQTTFTVVPGAATASVSIQASPTSLTAGHTSTLSASATNVPFGDYIQMVDENGDKTLSGANTYSDQKTGETSLTTPATSPVATTDSYIAELVNSSTGQVDAKSSPVSITWNAAAVESITVSASPTTVQSGQGSVITYTTTNFQPGDKVMVVGVGNTTPIEKSFTQSSGSFYQVESPTDGNSITMSISATIVDSAGQTVASASGGQITWKSTPPTISLTASPTTMVPGQPSTLQYSVSGQMGPGDTVSISGIGNALNSWSVQGSANYTESYKETESPSAGQTTSETYTANIENSSGQVISSANVTVKWVNAWSGSLSLSANPNHLPILSSTTLTTTTSQAIPSGYTVYVIDESTGQTIGSSGSAPFNTSYASYNAETDTFIAYVSDGYEQVGTSSNQVAVQWSQLALSANPTQLAAGQATTLTASGQNVPSGYYLAIYDQTTGQEIGYSQSTPYSVQVNRSDPETDTFVAYISPNNSQSGAYVSSNPITVTWFTVKLSAVPSRLPVNNDTTLTASAADLPSGYVIQILDQTTGQVIASGEPGQTTLQTVQSKSSAETDQYIAQVVEPNNPSIPGLSVPTTLPPKGIAVIEDVPGAGVVPASSGWGETTNPGRYISIMDGSGNWTKLNMANSVDSALISQPFVYDKAANKLVGNVEGQQALTGGWGDWGNSRWPTFDMSNETWTDINAGANTGYITGFYDSQNGLVYMAGNPYTPLVAYNPATGTTTQLGAYQTIGGYNRYTHKHWYISYSHFDWITFDPNDQIILAAATSDQSYWFDDLFEYNIKTGVWSEVTGALGWGLSQATFDSANDTFYFSVDLGTSTATNNLYSWNPTTGLTEYAAPPGYTGNNTWSLAYDPVNQQVLMESPGSGLNSYEWNPQTQVYTQIWGPTVGNMTYISQLNEVVGSAGNTLYAFNTGNNTWQTLGTAPDPNATIGGITYVDYSGGLVGANNYFPYWTFDHLPSYVPSGLFTKQAVPSGEGGGFWVDGTPAPRNGTAFFETGFQTSQTQTVTVTIPSTADDYEVVYVDGKPVLQNGYSSGTVPAASGAINGTTTTLTLSAGVHQVIIQGSNTNGLGSPAPNGARVSLQITASNGQVLVSNNAYQWLTTGYVTALPSGWFSGAIGTYNFTEYVLGEKGVHITQQAAYTVQTTAQNVDLQSQAVSVTWYQYGLTLTASPTSLLVDSNTTLSTTAPLGAPATSVIQIWNTTANTMIGQSGSGATTFSATTTRTTPGTDNFIAKLIDPANGSVYAETSPVSVTWNQKPLTLSNVLVTHTPHWLANIQTYNAANPNSPRSLSEFWAGEELVFNATPSLTSIASAQVTVSGLSYSSYAPVGAPDYFTVNLALNSNGVLVGNTDPSWEPWFQYLNPGTYTASFWVKSQDNQVSTATATFTINGNWTDFWKNTQVY